MSANAVTIIPEPLSRRQLGDHGLLVLWRDGSEPGRRQGLACVLSMCPNPGCVRGTLRSPGALRAALDPGLLHLRDDGGVGLGDVGGLAKAPPIDGEHVVGRAG